jgi:thiamine-phosphate pyrophosphorylase
LALRADGVHLGQDDLPPAEARRILGKDAIIGFSAHTAEQALAALSLPVDYIAIGPVFSTKTKEDPEEIVGLIGIENVRRAIGEFPLAAIGGIDAKTVNAVLDSGANSAAVISAILVPSSKIAENFHSLVELF